MQCEETAPARRYLRKIWDDLEVELYLLIGVVEDWAYVCKQGGEGVRVVYSVSRDVDDPFLVRN